MLGAAEANERTEVSERAGQRKEMRPIDGAAWTLQAMSAISALSAEKREVCACERGGTGRPPKLAAGRSSGGDTSACWSATMGSPIAIGGGRGDADGKEETVVGESCDSDHEDAADDSIGLSSPERMVGMVTLSRERLLRCRWSRSFFASLPLSEAAKCALSAGGLYAGSELPSSASGTKCGMLYTVEAGMATPELRDI